MIFRRPLLLHHHSAQDYRAITFGRNTLNNFNTFAGAMNAPENKIFYSTKLGESAIHGTGAFSQSMIPARRKIGSMGGVIISEREANRKAKKQEVVKLVELGNGKTLDGTVNANELCFVNHSCSPNTYIRIIGTHVEFYALRKIKPGEEITCDYGASYHEGKKPCGCKAENCAGYL